MSPTASPELLAATALHCATPTSRDLTRWHEWTRHADRVDASTVLNAQTWSPQCREQLSKVLRDGRVERELEHAARLNIRLLSSLHDEYPSGLRELADGPALLYLRGRGRLPGKEALTIVGARRSTHFGRTFARRIGRSCGLRGVVVLSGLARGIDQAAHEGALAGRGPTVAVLACGLDRLYPPGAERLAGQMEESGLLLSEMPLGTPPLRHLFPQRNRILAALSPTTLVVEADLRSGSLITARLALDLGRTVLAVPGALHQDTARGTNLLIQDGAFPILRPRDLDAILPPEKEAPSPETGFLDQPRTLEDIARQLKRTVEDTEVQLAEWESQQLVRCLGDRWIRTEGSDPLGQQQKA